MKSLSVRLAAVVSAVLFALMLVAGFFIDRQLAQTIHTEEANQAKVHAETLLASLQTLMLNGQGTIAREWLDRMRGAAGIVDIEVLRQDGREAFTDLNTVAKVNDFLNAPRFERLPVPPASSTRVERENLEKALRGDTTFDMSEADVITVLMPIPSATECLACHGYDSASQRGILKLSISTESRERRVAEMRASVWAVNMILIVVLAAALTLALRFKVLKPIAMLQQAIARVGEGDRGATLPANWKDELGQVATVFNRMQQQLGETETRIRSVMDNVVEAIVIINEQGTIETVNPATNEIFGYKTNELIGKNVSILMPEPFRSQHDGHLARYVATGKGKIIGTRDTEVVGMRKGGDTFPLEIGVSEMLLDDGRHFIGVVRDITERKQQSAALEHQALHDALTELPNRTLLGDRLRHNIVVSERNDERFALLLMDLDHFKEINDTLGHHFGDLILKEVARRLREALRESDTVARLGGDEFAVLVSSSDSVHAAQVAEKLLKSLEKPFLLEGQALHVGGSIGIAMYPDHGDDEITLLRLADVAMYVAKRATRGYALYDPTKDEHNPRSLTLLGELRAAIDEDQLVLHYQPKVDLATECICGAEALVRWQHPEHGLMLPDEFIPLAEQTGLIRPLTIWVLREALKQMTQWHAQGFNFDLSLNMSVRNLQDLQFPTRVGEMVGEVAGIPSNLWLEITETAIMADPTRAHEVLSTLNAMQVRLSIDDFGTGYSSLAYLKQLPVREIKIDKSFVMGMRDNENDAVIVRSIVDLAHNIGLRVIAEGVETEESYRYLRELGCDMAQGFYIAKPMPADDLMEWVPNSPWCARKMRKQDSSSD